MLQQLRQIPTSIWLLGLGTYFMDVAGIMIFTFSPIYLTAAFGVTALSIGFMEGMINGTSWIMRLLSGVLSDYFRVRKPIILTGYSFSALSRIIFAFLPAISGVFLARILDRLGHGIQASVRSAYIADMAPPHLKGACYGLRQAMGMAGSVTGALIGMVVMHYRPNDYKLIFELALLPSFIGLFVLSFGLKEAPLVKRGGSHKHAFSDLLQELRKLNKPFWMVLGTLFIYSLGWYSDVFLLLFAKKRGMGSEGMPFIMLLINLSSSLAAYPAGALSDQKNRYFYLQFGVFAAILANLCLVFSLAVDLLIPGALLWGIQSGCMHSLSTIIIADLAPKKLRATAFGIFYILNGIALFIASTLYGWTSKSFSYEIAFGLSIFFACVALLGIHYYRHYIAVAHQRSLNVPRAHH